MHERFLAEHHTVDRSQPDSREKGNGRVTVLLKTRDVTGIRAPYSTLSSESYLGIFSPPMKATSEFGPILWNFSTVVGWGGGGT